MTMAEIADELHLPVKNTAGIVAELVAVRLWRQDENGCVWIEKFEEETTPTDPRAAERMRLYRERKSGKSPSLVTDGYAVTDRNDTGEQSVTLRDRREKEQVEISSAKAEPAGKQTKLISDAEIRAREILAVFWPIVQGAVGTTLTRTSWNKRNKLEAVNFAQVGRSDDDLIRAHAAASRRLGSCVYSLKVVADELLRESNPTSPRPRPIASKYQEVSDVQRKLAADREKREAAV